MVTKEQREELSREWNKGGDRHGGEGEEEILDLLDALDEMERERDAEREAGLRHYLAAAEMYVKLDAATQERDAAIASKIEWSQHANNRANERDEATLRAERAERERDEALKSRIVAMEVCPGDSILYRLHGATEIIATRPEQMEHVVKHIRSIFDEAGFAGVKVAVIDSNDDVSVLRAAPKDPEIAEMRERFRYDEEKRGDS